MDRSTFQMFLVISLFVFFHHIRSGGSLPVNDSNKIANDFIGSFIDLFSYGDKLFGTPSAETGRKVDAWTSESDVHPEELGTYLEGDILHPEKLGRNGLIASSSRWESAMIPYTISSSFSQEERKIIESAMGQFHKLTCIRFVERNSPKQEDYIYIDNGQSGCWSSVGRVGGHQVLNLQSSGCLSTLGTPIHELMHAVGFLHEQNRWERDQHVTINWDNVEKGREVNFEKASKDTTDALGVGYDYRSVMHYSPYAFSTNGKPTIVAKVGNVDIGQRIGLSRKDVKKIYRMYDCGKYEKQKSE